MSKDEKISKLDKLKARQDAIKAKIQKIENQQKLKSRKDETRMKILVGSYYLDKAKDKGRMSDLKKEIDSFLKRKSDRELFGLKEIS